MKLSQFDYDLPKSLIAQYPTQERDESRLMVLNRKTGSIEHKVFKDLLSYFTDGDVMIVNNTKVFPARLFGRKEKTGAKIEVFLLRELNREMKLWDVLVDPARKIRVGNKLYFGDDGEIVAEVIDNTTSRGRTIRFLDERPYEIFKEMLFSYGETPLPMYIKRRPEGDDKDRYQTIFAKEEGAVAAPTAGLHFSREVMKRLELEGVNFAEVTLHVGLGTFRDIEVEDLSKHKMDSEFFQINESTAEIVNTAKDKNKKICAIGTTSMRAIESAVSASRRLKVDQGWTNLFCHPPYDFSIANSLLTNFHLPKSSLLIMVASFADYDMIMEAYQEAIKEKYRFFSYGDAMLII
ncbi:MAG: tRNA preQ1(34) S-adenosylmethionine ribosyltransferase-isomerase QueA [Chitinophagaceae bacterium]|nr:MAG: tRNA preQ1(34) S-adenosylmethionine ribosyltransferase-isomerase QueA [Chitinophagaceae bacterium]